MKNIVISPNFLVWKFCEKAQFPHSFGEIARNYAETVPFHKFHTRKLGGITVFFAAYSDYITSFEDLLKKDNSFKIHDKNIQSLAIDLFKAEKEIANLILCHIIPHRFID